MAKEIKQKIVLEGEQQYNAAIKEAQRNLKTLKSELKAETAELGKNATEQQKAEAKTKSLKAQIAEQEKIVKTLKEALAEAREEYGDNEDVVQRWEQKLNNARTTLANMKNDLEGVGGGFSTVGTDAAAATVATKSFADSLGSLSAVGESVAGAIEGIFQTLLDTVTSTISAVWEQMIDTATRANSWGDIAGYWNTDATNIQKWSHAVETAHDSFEDLSTAVTRINTRADADEHGVLAGVSTEAYKDRWEYAMAVMDSLSRMDYTEQMANLEEIFGEKRATKVMDLLNDWEKIRGNLGLFDVEQGGIGMTGEQMEDMSKLIEDVDKLNTTWSAFIDSFVAEHFAKLGLDLTGSAQTILEDLIKYVGSGDDADLQKLEEDIAKFFDRIKIALENASTKLDEAGKKLEESDNGIVKAIGKAMQGLADALEWISNEDNINKVIAAFEVLAAFWVAGKGLKLIGSIAELAANFKVIQGFSMTSGAMSLLGATGANATVGSLGSSIASALANVVLPVSLAAILCLPTLARLLQGDTRTDEEVARDEQIQQIGETMQEAGVQSPATGRDFLSWLATGKTPEANARIEAEQQAKAEAKAAEEAAQPRAYVDSTGPMSPVARARFDATAEQQGAANVYWDAWRSGDTDAMDQAYDAMVAAFEGNEKEFDRVDEWLDRIIEDYNARSTEEGFNEANWMDLPATWWKNPSSGADENGISSSDLEGFRGLPASMQTAVQNAVTSGISGWSVNLDGYTVGQLVADYVSQNIAAQIRR